MTEKPSDTCPLACASTIWFTRFARSPCCLEVAVHVYVRVSGGRPVGMQMLAVQSILKRLLVAQAVQARTTSLARLLQYELSKAQVVVQVIAMYNTSTH